MCLPSCSKQKEIKHAEFGFQLFSELNCHNTGLKVKGKRLTETL